MGIKEKLLSILAGLGAIASAVFYVLFLHKKQENLEEKNEALKKENEEKRSEIDDINKSGKRYKENLQNTHADYNNSVSGDINSRIELMQKLTENGKRRNKEN